MTTPKDLPAKSGCYCGCGENSTRFFRPGHDAKARSYLEHLIYGGEPSLIARMVVKHGYGPNGQNLKDEHDAECVCRSNEIV